ncbi:MAG: AraC family transcriptional regulator [Clostridia bacterium]|nr:AraC family transcriptional regulator [Clostridia bacterium]
MDQNICKFNLNSSNDLICSCFVLEKKDIQKKERRYNDYAVHLVMSGRGRITVNGRRYETKKGDLFFSCKDDAISIELGDMEYAYIRFHGRRAAEYTQRLDISAENCVFKGNDKLISFWNECLSSATDGNLDLLSEAVLLYSLALLKPKEKEENDIISRVIKLTGELFSDSSLSLSTIAARVGYNDKYISSLFKKQKGITYTRYLRSLRIKHSIFLMEQGIVSVKNVAILSGFGDALYFSKVFKEVEGISPKDFIKNQRSTM